MLHKKIIIADSYNNVDGNTTTPKTYRLITDISNRYSGSFTGFIPKVGDIITGTDTIHFGEPAIIHKLKSGSTIRIRKSDLQEIEQPKVIIQQPLIRPQPPITVGTAPIAPQIKPQPQNDLQNLVDDKLSGLVKTSKTIQTYSIVGTLVGLGFAYTKKTGVWGYVGYATLFGIIGGVVGFALRGKGAAGASGSNAAAGGGASSNDKIKRLEENTKIMMRKNGSEPSNIFNLKEALKTTKATDKDIDDYIKATEIINRNQVSNKANIINEMKKQGIIDTDDTLMKLMTLLAIANQGGKSAGGGDFPFLFS
jgi:hypothetical protein